MRTIFCLALLLKYATIVNVTVMNKFEADYLHDMKVTEDFVQDPAFWSVCESHFHSTSILTVTATSSNNRIWTDTISNLIEALFKTLNMPIIFMYVTPSYSILRSVEFSAQVDKVREYPPESSHSYLIITYSELDAYSYIFHEAEYPKNKWTPKDNYLILIILHNDWYACSMPQKLEDIFDVLWNKYWILNVVIMVRYQNICDKHTEVNVFNRFDAIKKDGVTDVSPDYVSELPKSYLERTWNLAGRPVRVTMFHSFPNAVFSCQLPDQCTYKGRDWKVIENLATFMNFTPVINQPSDGKRFGYKYGSTFTGSMGDLVYKNADISGNERYIKYYGTHKIEFTMPAFYTVQLVVVVPKAHRISLWGTVSKCFTFQFSVCLLAVFVVTAVLWYVLRKLRGKVSCLTNAVDTMAVFLTISLSYLTKISSLSQRVLLSSCLLFSLVIMCGFQSSLLHAVSFPQFLPDIDTLHKLDESGLAIVTLDPNLMDTFNASSAMRNLAVRLQLQNISEHTLLHQIAVYRNVSMLTNLGQALWYLNKYPDKLHIVNECPREYFVSYMIPKGSPYATRIHNLLGKMSEAGLLKKWDLDTRYNLKLEALREGTATIEGTGKVKVFTLVDFQLSFFVWGLGVTLCVVVFLLENLFGRIVCK
jgi:hypothetical protein